MLKRLTEYRGLFILVGLIAGGIWWFTPMTFAKETRQMVVEISLKDQLYYYEQQAWELEKVCTDLQTDQWLCSDEKKHKYETILIEIEILKAKLGIGG